MFVAKADSGAQRHRHTGIGMTMFPNPIPVAVLQPRARVCFTGSVITPDGRARTRDEMEEIDQRAAQRAGVQSGLQAVPPTSSAADDED